MFAFRLVFRIVGCCLLMAGGANAQGYACQYSWTITPSIRQAGIFILPYAATQGTFEVTTSVVPEDYPGPVSCPWSLTSQDPWFSVSSSSFLWSGTVPFTLSAGGGLIRTASLELRFGSGLFAAIPVVQAASIACGQMKSGSVSTPSDAHAYQFSGNVGDVVDISLFSTSGGNSYGLFGTDGNAWSPQLPLPQSGTYTIVVVPVAGTGSYEVDLQFTRGGTCAVPIACGQTLTGSLASTRERDAYRFSGNAGEKVTAPMSTGEVQFYDPAGNKIVRESGVYTLPSSGAYTLFVGAGAQSSIGTYHVSLQFLTGRCAASITCGQTLSSTTPSKFQVDAFTFSGTAGRSVGLFLPETLGSFTRDVELFDPGGSTVDGSGFGPSWFYTLPASGTYTALVTNREQGGDRRFALACQGVCTPILSPTSGTFGSAGGIGDAVVTTGVGLAGPDDGCCWASQSHVSWVRFISGGSACRSWAPAYEVDPFAGPGTRTGTMTIAGQAFTVTQSSSSAPCSYTLSASSALFSNAGGRGTVTLDADGMCKWTARSNASWVSITTGVSRSGDATIHYAVAANAGAARTETLTVAGLTFTVNQDATSDVDADGLPDGWEAQLGLDPRSASADDGPDGDPDGDGRTNAQEYAAGTHPRGFITRYFAEGTASSFFTTTLAFANAGGTTANVLVRFVSAGGAATVRYLTVPPLSRQTLDMGAAAGDGEFATVVESDVPLVADRTMAWDASGYGTHAETSLAAPATTWYLAEGATHSGFDLFYLLQNPNGAPATVTVTYLLPAPAAPVTKTYGVPGNSRFNIWVDVDDPRLTNTDVSAKIGSDVPIIVERAMYLNAGGVIFGAGHESAGVTETATNWFLAEGATGPYFDLFILIANPNDEAADVMATYLLDTGSMIVRTYTVAPKSRFNIWVDTEPGLADQAVSTTITSTNGVGILVERAMWWPGDATTWFEAHNSPGATSTGTRWALAEGEVGGTNTTETYILIANTSTSSGSATVTLLFEDGTTAAKAFALPATSRVNVNVASDFPSATGMRFGAIIESMGPTPAQIVVERAMYSNSGTTVWAAGSNSLATKLQ